MSEILKTVATAAPTSWVVSGTTTVTGVAAEYNLFDWIPDDIGKLASLVGLALAGSLLYYRILVIRKLQIELKQND